jgi:hypothetical protein
MFEERGSAASSIYPMKTRRIALCIIGLSVFPAGPSMAQDTWTLIGAGGGISWFLMADGFHINACSRAVNGTTV